MPDLRCYRSPVSRMWHDPRALLLSHAHAVRATTMHPAVWLWVALLARDMYRRYVAHDFLAA